MCTQCWAADIHEAWYTGQARSMMEAYQLAVDLVKVAGIHVVGRPPRPRDLHAREAVDLVLQLGTLPAVVLQQGHVYDLHMETFRHIEGSGARGNAQKQCVKDSGDTDKLQRSMQMANTIS